MTIRIVPFLFLLYIVAWLDRVNVGFAALQMNSDLGFSSAAFGFGSGIFFLGYCLFEVPSNYILYRVGARRWIARILVTWGLISTAMIFVRTPTGFYTLRFLLGVAEAGFFPGVIYYLGFWFPAACRARAISRFMMAIPVAALVGGPLSGILLSLDEKLGLQGWQWLFLAEGVPAILLGVITLFVLPDGPRQARWLQPEERDSIIRSLAAEQDALHGHRTSDIRAALNSFMVWRLGFTYLLSVIGFYGYAIWSPLIIKSLTGLNDLGVGMVAGALAAAAIVCMLLNGAHSDRSGERPLHVAVPILLMAIGFLGTAALHSPPLALVALALIPIGNGSSNGPFWALPTQFLTGEAAACGIALVATIVNVGGFVGPTLVGVLKGWTGNYVAAFYILSGLALASSLLAASLRSSAEFRAHTRMATAA